EIVQDFIEYVKKNQLPNNYFVESGVLILEVEGVSAHGMEPKNGKNAGLYLAEFLSTITIDEQATRFFTFVKNYFQNDSRGKAFGINYADDITGELTVNVGVLIYHQSKGGQLGLSIRYPVTNDTNQMMDTLKSVL